MAKTYAQIIKQIESLQGAAEKLRTKEVEGVIGRIKEAIVVYSLTAEDLGFSTSKAKAGAPTKVPSKRGRKSTKAAKSAKGGAAVVKFANGEGGTWGGRGKRPQWLRDALAGGKTLAEFAVK